jgi:predicted nucleic acid-binding protein
MVIIDTNIVIDHIRQKDITKDTILIKLSKKFDKNTIAVSTITIAELFAGKSTRNINKETALLRIISPFRIIPVNYEIAKLAGEISRDNKNYLELADATIAATSIINHAPLLTLNENDFSQIKGLELLSI